jgi:hypothetical protein
MGSNRHIQFDLSKNQTYIIDNNDDIDTDTNTIRYIATITIVTSFLFIINTSLAYSKKNYIYAGLFLFLFLTSIVHRYIQNTYGLNKYIFLADEIAIFFIVVYGAYMLYTKINNISKIYLGVIISIFIATVILYCYGYNYECFCFDRDQYISENYMALLHIIGSIGHNFIILL